MREFAAPTTATAADPGTTSLVAPTPSPPEQAPVPIPGRLLGNPSGLRVGEADDATEREADRAARSVVERLRAVGGPEPSIQPSPGPPVVARTVDVATLGPAGGAVDEQTQQTIEGMRGRGRPLPGLVRRSMEDAFGGADFSAVRVHEGGASRALNESLGARAFTLGSDLWFRDGMPDATSAGGQHLLAHELTHTLQQGGARIRRTIGRSDGNKDLSAGEVQDWLTHQGIWDTLTDDQLDTIEEMLKSEHHWSYSGVGSWLVRDARALGHVVYSQGLIHGDWFGWTNKADFHVSKGDGRSLPKDMLTVAQDIRDRMVPANTEHGAPRGQVYLRPQGAAVIKIVSQLLGEAVGDPALVEEAHKAIGWRKLKEKALDLVPLYTRPKMSDDVLDKSVAAEHKSYMRSLVGIDGVDIKPLILGTASLEEFTQNMLAATQQGQDRLQKYLAQVEQANVPVSMDIFIDQRHLDAVVAKLEAPPTKV